MRYVWHGEDSVWPDLLTVAQANADPNSPGEHLPIIKAIRRHRENDLSYIEALIDKGADINLMYVRAYACRVSCYLSGIR